MLILAVAAAFGNIVALRRIVQVRKTRVIQLQVCAPEFAERIDFVRIHILQVVPEQAHFRIDARVDDG